MSNPPKPRTPKKMSWSRRILIYVVIALVTSTTLIWFAQRKIVFPRWTIPPEAQIDPTPSVEVWTLDTEAGPVEAWFIPGQGRSAQSPGPAVIFSHGNAELIDHWPRDLQPYTQQGVSLLLPEYRGYGRSSGSPSQQTVTDDFVAFYDRLIEDARVDPAQIILHGRSIGGGVAAQLADRRPSAALIIESSFTSVRAMAGRYFVPGFMVRDPFDTLAVVRRYDQPLLIMHGRADQIIPPSHADTLAQAGKKTQRIYFPNIGHNDRPPKTLYWSHIMNHLDLAQASSRTAP